MIWRKVNILYKMNLRNRLWALWHLVIKGEILTLSYFKAGDEVDDACLTIDGLKEWKND